MTTYLEWGYFDAAGKFTRTGYGLRTPPGDAAVYRCAGRLKAGATRSNENVEAVEVLTIDDVGTKIDMDAMAMMGLTPPVPSDILETSPGNFQWQYRIAGGMDPKDYVALRSAMKSHPVWGKSEAIAPSNLIRVAQGVNGKPGFKTWKVRRTGGSGAEWSPEGLITAFGGISPAIAVSMSGALEAPSRGALQALLARLPNDGVSPYCDSYDAWVEFGLALWGATGGAGLDLWEGWCSTQIQQQDETAKWASFSGTSIGWPTLCMYEDRWGSGSRHGLAAALFDDGAVIPDTAIAGTPDAKQLRYALEVVRRFGARIRYNFDRGAWHLFDGCIWEPLPTKRKLAFELSMGVAMTAPPGSAAILAAGFHDGVENFCRQSGTLHAREADFDRDPWLLGTPGGTVDLRTGALVPARASDMIAKSAAVAPGGACPRWNKFIAEICGNDLAAMEYLQQYAGYCLTGETSEQIFLFLHGSGGNGKSVFADTLMAVMGDYAVKPVGDLFIKKAHGVGHTSKLAMLAGARLCTVSEVPSGAQWDEGLLKDITGGGTMTAGFKHKDEFTFAPRFKLLALGNNQPSFPGGINPAIRRRFRMMEFAFQPKVVDKDLMEKLRGEWGGILSWMIAGCLKWQKTGLITPDAVDTATAGFFEEQDLLGLWIKARVEPAPGALCDATDMFRDWIDFRNMQGNHELFNGQQAFGKEMTDARGFVKGRSKHVRGYVNVRLRARNADVFGDGGQN